MTIDVTQHSSVQRASNHALLHLLERRSPHLYGGPPDEPPPAPPTAVTFASQADLDKLIERRINDERKKYAGFDDLKTKAGQVDELTKKIGEIQQQYDDLEARTKGEKPDATELRKLQRQIDGLNAKLVDETKKYSGVVAERDAVSARYTTRAKMQAAADALARAKVLPQASMQAARLFIDDAKLEATPTDDGDFTFAATFGGTPYDDLGKAAEAWLKTNGHFAQGAPAGAGTKPPLGGPGPKPALDIDKAPAEVLVAQGLGQPLPKTT